MGTRAPPLSGQVVGIVEIQGENVGSGWGCGKPKIDLGLKKELNRYQQVRFMDLKYTKMFFFGRASLRTATDLSWEGYSLQRAHLAPSLDLGPLRGGK